MAKSKDKKGKSDPPAKIREARPSDRHKSANPSAKAGLEFRRMRIGEIRAARYNPRKKLGPDDAEYRKLQKSLERFGCVDPLVWNARTKTLVGGHQRLQVLTDLGEAEVDVAVVNLSRRDEKALNLALNKIEGDWDLAKLKDALEELDNGSLDMEVTGFDDKEIERLMTQFHVPESPDNGEPEPTNRLVTCPKCGKKFEV